MSEHVTQNENPEMENPTEKKEEGILNLGEGDDKNSLKKEGEEGEEAENSGGENLKKEDSSQEEKDEDNLGEGVDGEGEGGENQNEEVKESENGQSKMEQEEQISKEKENTFENLKALYKFQLKQLRNHEPLVQLFEKFWELLPHTFEGEISKGSFLLLYGKILKLILPLFNYGEIERYSEGTWNKYTKGKQAMSLDIFQKVLFDLTHLWSVHINKDEYEDFLNLIYRRITRVRKYYPNGEDKVFYPSIKVNLINSISKEDFENSTWENFKNIDNLHLKLYETQENSQEEEGQEEKKADENQKNDNIPSSGRNNGTENSLSQNGDVIKARPKLKIDPEDIPLMDDSTEKEKTESKGVNNDDKKQQGNSQGKNEEGSNGGFDSYYKTNDNFYLYNEETFYLNQNEIDDTTQINTHIKYELIDDNEIIIYGYPTQFVLNKFINEPQTLKDIQIDLSAPYNSEFYITDYQPYEKQKIYLKIYDKDKLIEFLEHNKRFILIRDIFSINQNNSNFTLGSDFSEVTLNIVNNLRRNLSFDRYFKMYDIVLPGGQKLKVNLDHLILNNTCQKAFGNIFDYKKNKIGIKSRLWEETIENKKEKIIKTKFLLIHIKLLNLNLNYDLFESLFNEINDEKATGSLNAIKDTEEKLNYFDKFKSKEGIKVENFDNENDLYDEVNKKSPVIFVMGPPRIGKSKVSQKLADDLNMVYLEPTKFFESIFKKVADFEEKMLTWDEEHPKEEEAPAEENNEEQGDEDAAAKKKKEKDKLKKKEEQNYLASWEPEPQKNVKPELDSALTEVEFAVYNDLMSGKGVSELNMQRMFMYMLHSDLAISRGVVIDMNSYIPPKHPEDPNNDTRSFTEKILTGFYGDVKIDYVVELGMDKEELSTRNKKMKINMKTMQKISERDIELMKKPKVQKKEILEDEIEYDEEGKEIIPEPEPEPELGDEELEKIPKKEDLLEINYNEKIFEEQYKYYESVQKPAMMKYVSTLKKNYYINVDITGLDFDDVANLIKCKLDFANPLRPIARALEAGDFKGLLQEGREGVLPYRKWSQWKQIDPVSLKDEYLILTGNTEFPAIYFGRVFLFVSDENRKKFIENPKKYISCPPQVPANYRISIIGPSKSGKSLIAQMLSEIYGWKVIDMEEIYEKVKEYQKTWSEPELNSVYTRRVHFSSPEFKELLANLAKKPSERKPDNFVSKIVFMLDAMGIPLDKKKTKEQFFAFRKYHRNKLTHMFNRIQESKDRQIFEENEEKIRVEEEEAENKRLEEESKLEETLFTDMTECARSLYEVEKDKRAQSYADHVAQKEKEKEQRQKDLEEKEKKNPYPPEEEYVIEDLKSDQFFLAFDEKGEHPRVNGIILMNHPLNEDECNKLKDFNIMMDRIIYIKDDSEEGIKALTERRIPNFASLKEEKQAEELEKTKADAAKYEEVIGVLKEKYNVNNEEAIIEVGYNEPLEQLKLKLENALNPFNIKIDQDDKVILPADVNPEEKYPLTKGPFGLFCPVIYKEDNWLFYAPEANEVQVNQKVYRISGEKEMELFKADPAKYLGVNGSVLPIDVPPPHIMITGYQGSGITFYSNVLSKQFRLSKREIQKDFMEIWEKQKKDRKQKRVEKKKEELKKQNEEIEQKNADLKKENPEAEGEPLINIDEVVKEDAALDEEGEDYNATENDKLIFKSLFKSMTPTIYDASWNGMEEKVAMPFVDLLTESRRVPNVMIVLKVTLKSVMDRLFRTEEIEEKYEKMLKESNDKRKQKEEDLIKQKRQEKFDELKAAYDEEQAQLAENQGKEEEKKEEGGEENPEGEEKPKRLTMPVLEQIKIELTQEEKDEIWNTPDPDLVEKDALIQQEKDRLSQRFEANVASIQTLVDTLKERGVPVIEINNDTTRENVYTNLLLCLSPYINNRKNLIEKQLVYNKEFPTPLSLRKVRDLYTNSEVYLPSVYGKLSPIKPSKLCIRTDYPVVYRDRVYLFNSPDEKKIFEEFPLDYRTGLECPKDAYPMKGRTIIFSIGTPCSGKTTLAKLMSEQMGYQRMTVKRATLDLLKMLKECSLLNEIKDTLFNGKATDDSLIIKILNRRVTMEDLVNENLIIDGFPYTLSQANLLPETLTPDLIFVAQCERNENMKRCFAQKKFKAIPEVVHERNSLLESHFTDILHLFKGKQYDIRYFDMTKSKWFIKDQILDLIQTRKQNEMKFARNLALEKPCELNGFTPSRLIKSIRDYSKLICPTLMYSPVALKTSFLFFNNKNMDNSWNNYIIYTPIKEEEKRKKTKRKSKGKSEKEEVKESSERKEILEEKNEEEEDKKEENKEEEKKEENKEEEKKEEIKEEEKKEEIKEEEIGKYNNFDSEMGTQRTQKYKGTESNKEDRITEEEYDEEENQFKNFKNLKNNSQISQFHFLTKEDEVSQFMKNPDDYIKYLLEIKNDILPPKILSSERIAEILYKDEIEETNENEGEEGEDASKDEDSELEDKKEENALKLGKNVVFEYQNCCPVSIVEDKLMRIGKLAYTAKYCGKYYKFLSMENMIKFKKNPKKYINLTLPIRKVNIEKNLNSEKQIMFNNTVNFLEFTFGSLITKGMLELSNNRIKYPYLYVKESSLKYLALFLKANNPNNNEFAKNKYQKILKDFIRNSKLPLELYNVFENYKNVKNDELHKKLIRNQLDSVSSRYDDLMEKAKVQNNTRFANFFKLDINENEDNNK